MKTAMFKTLFYLSSVYLSQAFLPDLAQAVSIQAKAISHSQVKRVILLTASHSPLFFHTQKLKLTEKYLQIIFTFSQNSPLRFKDNVQYTQHNKKNNFCDDNFTALAATYSCTAENVNLTHKWK